MRHTLFLLFLLPSVALGYQNKPAAVIDAAIKNIRTGKYEPVKEDALFEPANHTTALEILAAHYEDSIARVRDKVYNYTKRIGQASEDNAIRRQAVDQLITGLDDSEASVVNTVLQGLGGFYYEDFSDADKAIIAGYLQASLPHYDKLLRLAGFLQLQDQQSLIRSKVSDRSQSRAVRWAARLALARMGDEATLKGILDKLEALEVNDDIVYEICPDLIYTRQKAAFDYMVGILKSEERKCYAANPDATDMIQCGYRIMEFFPGVVEGFPLQAGPGGDIETDDYKKALETARDWFAAQAGNYTISQRTM